jgi:EAL domain-containing protein (putative c-di-GMP-specific phosphodiesterase class I)
VRETGADFLQGYLIAPPLECEDATEFLARDASSPLMQILDEDVRR